MRSHIVCSVAVLAILSVGHATAEVTTVSLVSPHLLMTPNISTKISCTATLVNWCRRLAEDECRRTQRSFAS